MRPYHRLPIRECREPLQPIPRGSLAWVEPHPYASLGAPYGDRDPDWLRSGVLKRLLEAQATLSQLAPGWRLQIFDAYRPVEVQAFMVQHTLGSLARERGVDPETGREKLLSEVYRIWSPPNLDPAAPPPHSTGAAVDLTLVDAQGQPVFMGSPIDELSERSAPDYYAESDPVAHGHRQLLNQVMTAQGFARHPGEWWHFSWGDQLWAWVQGEPQAYYGRYSLLEA